MILGAARPLVVTAIGAFVGLLGGLFGQGGSALATPLLHLAGVPALVAVASPLPATVPGAAAAAATFWRHGLVDRRILAWTLGIGIPATVVGALATPWIGGAVLVAVTDAVVLALGARVLLWPTVEHSERKQRTGKLTLVVLALTVGTISGLLANSGGFLLAPLFAAVLGLPIKRALATSLAASCVLAVPGTAVHFALGHVDLGVVGAFAIASVPCSLLGAQLAIRAPTVHLQKAYGAVLAAMGLAFLVAT